MHIMLSGSNSIKKEEDNGTQCNKQAQTILDRVFRGGLSKQRSDIKSSILEKFLGR